MPIRSLSARLLVLTVFFVMLGEVLIFVPSVARYRMTYFENHLAAGASRDLGAGREPDRQDRPGLDRPAARAMSARTRSSCTARTAWC